MIAGLRLVRFHAAASAALQHSRGMASMPLTFASPTRVFYNNQGCQQVDVPSFSGNFGILPNHVPLLAVLRPGIVTVFEENGKTEDFFVSSGSVTVNNDATVQVLAEVAVPVSELDSSACANALKEANSKLAAAKNDEERAEAQIFVETSEALVKACA